MIENNENDDIIRENFSPHILSKLQKKKYFSKRNLKYLICLILIMIIVSFIYFILLKKRNYLIENNNE